MQRTLFTSEHLLFQHSFRTFVEREIAPHYARWEQEGIVDRACWARAGAAGFLALGVPEEDGGSGIDDFRYNTVIVEELARNYFMGVGFPVHIDIVTPYLVHLAAGDPLAAGCPR